MMPYLPVSEFPNVPHVVWVTICLILFITSAALMAASYQEQTVQKMN